MSRHIPSTAILKDIEALYRLALQEGSLATALKAKELIGRAYGLFSSSSCKALASLKDLSDEDLDLLIKDMETRLKEEDGIPPEARGDVEE